MANVLVSDASLQDIADAIREKNGTEETYKPAEMGAAVRAIESGGVDYLASRIQKNGKQYEYYSEAITSLDVTSFFGDEKIISLSLPNCKLINNEACKYASNLKKINFPTLGGFTGSQHFSACGLEEIKLLTLNGSNGHSGDFRNNFNLRKAEYNYLKSVITSAFNGCSSLSIVIIRSDSIAALSNVNAFTGTPIASGTGYIYVPRALVDTYKAATNWVTYAEQIRALEDYTVDGTITGALDENKIAT